METQEEGSQFEGPKAGKSSVLVQAEFLLHKGLLSVLLFGLSNPYKGTANMIERN